MKRLWNDLLNEPVLIFGVATATTAALATVYPWAAPVSAVVAAVGAFVTRHYTTPTRKL